MRAVALLVLASLCSLSHASELSPACRAQLNARVGQLKLTELWMRVQIHRQIAVLQENAIEGDLAKLRAKCEQFKAAVDKWEHTEEENDKALYRKTLAAQSAFVAVVNGMISRSRAGWDTGLKTIETSGYGIKYDRRNATLVVSRDLQAESRELGPQRMDSVLEFCAAGAEAAHLGQISTEVFVSEKGDRGRRMSLDEYAELNLTKSCDAPAVSGDDELKAGATETVR